MRKPWNDKAWGDYPYRQNAGQEKRRGASANLMVYKVENSDVIHRLVPRALPTSTRLNESCNLTQSRGRVSFKNSIAPSMLPDNGRTYEACRLPAKRRAATEQPRGSPQPHHRRIRKEDHARSVNPPATKGSIANLPHSRPNKPGQARIAKYLRFIRNMYTGNH